jgi:hypothetical protein
MSSGSPPANPSRPLPAKRRRNTLDDIFGPVQLLPSESRSAWIALQDSIAAELQATGVLGQMFVREIAQNTWQEQRLRRLQGLLLIYASHAGVLELLKPRHSLSLGEMDRARSLAEAWRTGDSDAVKEVDELLARAGLSRDAIYAVTLADRFEAFERIERMIASLEVRHMALLREVDYRRSIQDVSKQILLEPAEANASPVETASGNGNSTLD